MNAQLGQYRWENRILLIFAENKDSQLLSDQIQLLQEVDAGLKERDMIVFSVSGDFAQALFSKNNKQEDWGSKLRKRYGISTGDFRVLLIGKDGGEKRVWKKVVDSQEVFDLIDSMPMRRMEMRRGKRG